MKKFIVATLVAFGFAAFAASSESTPDGCMPGNGGMHPICTPTGGGGQ